MRMLSDPVRYFALIIIILSAIFVSSCVDSVEPAGTAQYTNPEYPSLLKGYAVITSVFSGAFSLNGRVYVLDGDAEIIESFSLSDPRLNMNPSPVEKDTLPLGFDPGDYALDRVSEVLYLEDAQGKDIYRIQLPDGTPELLYQNESFISELFLTEGNSNLVICFLGPEWMSRKIDVLTGSTLGEFETGWPITRAAMSFDSGKLLLSNSSKQFLLQVDVATMQLADTLHLLERPGPFIYNTSGDIIVFNQYSIKPVVYLYDGNSGELLHELPATNPYQICDVIPGTDVIIAPRRSETRVSILNSDNMIFAPSIYCMQYADLAFSTQDGQTIIVLTDNPGRVYIYSHQ
ncbi:MAG: hypothetical protein KAH31_07025 [Candidatus Sabulitectum sp.]|nr:hypothetical protein [Candidatus Sabulitectum sp.]